MMWNLPYSVLVDGVDLEIENDCDYRVVLDVLSVYEDVELDIQTQHRIALGIFYKEPQKITNGDEAVRQMFRIIDCEIDENATPNTTEDTNGQRRLMCWSKDFKFIAPAVSRVLGYDVRMPKNTHWWTFYGAFLEIGECVWSTFISIRKKRMNGQKLEEWEQKVYRDNKQDIDLPQNLTEQDKEWLEDW